MVVRDVAQQAWPPFVIVAGLLMIGLVADADGLFARAGSLLERMPGPNLAASGSLSAYLWMRAADQVGARPSIAAFSGRGVILAPLAIGAALVAAGMAA